ncbi:LysR family transcriptional regulator [Variovorax sp. J22P168]|uniref:LysR family transcriptional regulator n=1 Tax=Variovorax jilinensis TaxID=3053513 RepID=UPI0025767B6C|nr:LysR family transcriptional regulator [Variovorax sp. J22P168]MDM0014800.1 LysR family transcriptional regulator [Variovorax sp. J22P168]
MAIQPRPLSALPSVRQLRAFVAVFHSGSISAAAQELSLTQPAVTMLVRELETRLGVSLFDRRTRAVHRTDAAVRAIAYAERALAEMEGLSSSMSELAGLHAGRVRVVATAAVAQAMLPPAMRKFLERHPGVSLEIEEVGPADYIGAVQANHVDFGIGTLEAPVTGLREEVLICESLVAASLPSSTFPGGVSMTWKQLSAFPIITVRSGYGIRRRIEAAARDAGVELRIAHEVSLLATAVALAANGLGVVVVPPSIVARETKLVTRRLTRPTVERVIGAHFQRARSLSPAAEKFVATLKQVAGQGQAG